MHQRIWYFLIGTCQAQGEGGAAGTSLRGPGGPYLFNYFYVGMARSAVQRVHNYECGPENHLYLAEDELGCVIVQCEYTYFSY